VLRPLIYPVAFYLFVGVVLRLVLVFIFGDGAISLTEISGIVLSGLLSDLVVAGYLSVLPMLYLAFVPVRLFRQRWHQRLLTALTFSSFFAIIYLCVAEFFFFEEFNSRFNLVAVDYLIYPHEVFINIWDSYPVLSVICFALVLSASLFYFLWPPMSVALHHVVESGKKRKRLALVVVVLPLFSLVSTDSFNFSDNRVVNQISHNGVSSLFQAFRTNELNYDTFYRTMDRREAFTLLRSELLKKNQLFCSPHADNINRFHASKDGLGKLNVVVVVEESFGSNYVGILGDNRNLTPNFDQLSQRGMLFRHCYATGTRTVRGLEAITSSFPPIPSESIIKRPGNENIANWGNVMNEAGYRSSFIYGGYGYFDNMNPFYQSNGFALQDRSDIANPKFSNIWGVSDGDLFNHAIGYFDQQQQPFFSIIMTTSNHKPYTFPEGIEGVPTEGGGRKAGIRYADYALGQFFKEAERHAWFDNTLFVVVADHGARVYGKQQVPMKSYEIPLLIFAPAKIAPSQVTTLTSQMDIAPTVLGLLGLSYTAPFYGQDVLAGGAEKSRAILLNHNHDVALYQDNQIVVLGLNKTATTQNYNPETHEFSSAHSNMALTDLATAYYQTAFELFSNHRYL